MSAKKVNKNQSLERAVGTKNKKSLPFLYAILVLLLPSLLILATVLSSNLISRVSVSFLGEEELVLNSIKNDNNTPTDIVTELQHASSPPKTTMIRKWGCDRQEEIFTFVHIGKSGGGNIRPRIAFSAQNVTRTDWREWDNHYYPMEHGQGKFCTSRFINYRLKDTRWHNKFEGTVECSATTPLGIMVACPGTVPDCGNCEIGGDFCGIVYVGHNLMGSELHWMNHHVLKKWWSSNQNLYPELYTHVLNEIDLQHPDNVWCNETLDKVPENAKAKYSQDKKFVKSCTRSRANRIDRVLLASESRGNFASIYASLPVLRSTVLREPWSWFLSKYFWHKREVPCDDIEAAVEFPNNFTGNAQQGVNKGWLKFDAYLYLFYLCGADCVARYEKGIASQDELEAQAADNLRNSFAVVGLLEDQEMFFDMIDARVAYMDMRASNEKGEKHASGGGAEKERCIAIYSDESFRAKLTEKLPVLGTLERLYKLGKEVNRAQIEDLRQCNSNFRSKYPGNDDR